MCVCSVENVLPTLNPTRVAVVLEALQSHKKSDVTAEDAATLFALLSWFAINCTSCLHYLLPSVFVFVFAPQG